MLEARSGRRTALAILLLAVAGEVAAAEPMRLSDPTPRWVMVQFEDSPSEHPDRLDRVYTKPFAAWLEPDAHGRVTVRVEGAVLEKSLFYENDPVPGSFSDYLWVFEPESGEVVSASFTGAFAYVIDWGFSTSEVRARVTAEMRTTGSGGLRGPVPVWGQTLHAWCPDLGREGCREVPRAAYDPERGYVNAIGYLSIDSPVTQFATYSAVGEARFSEVPGEFAETPRVASGPDAASSAAAALLTTARRGQPDREPLAAALEAPAP